TRDLPRAGGGGVLHRCGRLPGRDRSERTRLLQRARHPMSTSTLILGSSGSGKSTSLRNMDAHDTLLIQAVRKPLPFPSKEWRYFHKDTCPTGNVFVTDQWDTIIKLATKTGRKVIVIDDFQYVLANEFMRRSDERGFDKLTEIGLNASVGQTGTSPHILVV